MNAPRAVAWHVATPLAPLAPAAQRAVHRTPPRPRVRPARPSARGGRGGGWTLGRPPPRGRGGRGATALAPGEPEDQRPVVDALPLGVPLGGPGVPRPPLLLTSGAHSGP